MTCTFGPPIRARGLTLLAVSETCTLVRPILGTLVAQASKRPIILLVDDGTEVTGLRLDGERLSAEELAAVVPDFETRMRDASHRDR